MSKKNRSTAKPQAKALAKAQLNPERPLDPLKAERIEGLLAQSPGWHLARKKEGLTRSFQFSGLPSATAFANLATSLGAEQDHPTRVVQDGETVTCTVYSLLVRGVTRRDFEVARKISLQE